MIFLSTSRQRPTLISTKMHHEYFVFTDELSLFFFFLFVVYLIVLLVTSTTRYRLRMTVNNEMENTCMKTTVGQYEIQSQHNWRN